MRTTPAATLLALGLCAPMQARQGPDVSALARELSAPDSTPSSEVFETIGAARTRLALNTLIGFCEHGRADFRAPAYHALHHFFGVPELEGSALAFLAEHSLGAQGQAATRALVRYASVAQPELERVLLESEDEVSRQRAVGGLLDTLVERGDPQALELLLTHYHAPISGSGERGALALASFRGEAQTQALLRALTRSKTPPETRAMIVSALALRPDPPVLAALKKALRDEDALVVVAAIEALRMRRETDHLDQLSSLLRSKAPSVRFAASRERLRGSPLDGKQRAELTRALASRDFALRMAAAAALAWDERESTAEALAQLIDDEHGSVRREAIASARRRRIQAAIPHLIGRLEQDGPALRELAAQALRELSGLDLGPDRARWLVWWQTEGESFVLPEREFALAQESLRRERRASVPTQSPSLFGLPFAADRVVFVLDLSGSMQTFGRLERMQRELYAALDQMPDGALFNLIFFGDAAVSGGEQLLRMEPRTREWARRNVARARELGGTNLHAALRAAFRMDEVETIFVLSDGEPTVGVTGLSDILRDVRRWNELRGIRVDTVSIGWDGSLLEAISALTGGEARSSY